MPANDSDARFAKVFDHSPVALLISAVDDGKILEANEVFCQLVGYSHAELLGRSTLELNLWVTPASRTHMVECFRRQGHVRNAETEFRDRTGVVHSIKMSIEAISFNGQDCLISTALDITESKHAEAVLAESERRFRCVTSMTSDMFYTCVRAEDGYFRIQWLGGDAPRVLGCDADELRRLGCWRGFVLPEDQSLFDMNITNLTPGQSSDIILRIKHRDGSVRYIRCYARVEDAPDGGRQHQLYGAVQDITGQMRLEQQLEHQAHTDYLTGLANRRHFLEQAQLELARARRYLGQLSIAMLDLDHFKQVNDTYGHEIGDRVLKAFAEIARRTLREIDMMGRMGGEEFAILFPETNGVQAYEVAERLRVAIANAEIPMERGLPIRITASLGLTTFVAGDANIDVLLSRADQALYEAKRLQRNNTCVARISD
jgi:diguanylate cyclase (GGDEF)-like protein/PAS domain S-box-containing protein